MFRWAAAAVLAAMLACVPAASAAPGDLDVTFGDEGHASAFGPPGASYSKTRAGRIQVLPDASILALGWGYDAVMSLAKWTPDGELDATFGTGGMRSFPELQVNVADFAVDSEGRIITAGNTGTGGAAVARHLPNGSVDQSFGTGGKIVWSSGMSVHYTTVAIMPGDQIVLGGSVMAQDPADSSRYVNHWLLARYNADGTLDDTFGNAGRIVGAPYGNGWQAERVREIVIQPDGKILAGGSGQTDEQTTSSGYKYRKEAMTFARYDEDGELDPGFSGDGLFAWWPGTADQWINGHTVSDIALQADGKILAASDLYDGGNSEGLGLLRVNPNGSLDDTYGGNGQATATFSDANFAAASGVVVQPDGKAVVAGISYTGYDYRRALARFTTDGALDTSFGSGGKILHHTGYNEHTDDVAMQGARILTVGQEALNFDHSQWLVAAYHSVQAPPRPLTAPYVEGEPRADESITAWRGGWHEATEYHYQWQVCDTADADPASAPDATGCVNVGMDKFSYVPTAAQVDKHLRVVITARNSGGDATATSATAKILAQPPVGTYIPQTAPEGNLRPGDVLTLSDDGTWSGTPPMTQELDWMTCTAQFDTTTCTVLVDNDSDDSYTVVVGDVGKWLRARVTKTNSGGSASRMSNAQQVVEAPVNAQPPVNQTAPTVTPESAVTAGATLTGTDGTWGGKQPITLSRRWQRCTSGGASPAGCSDIDGATSATYVTSSLDAGTHVRLRVSASNADGNALAYSTTREVKAPVVDPEPTVEPTPSPTAAPTAEPTPSATPAPTATAQPVPPRVDPVALGYRLADSRATVAMPDVRCLPVDEAEEKIRAALQADVDVVHKRFSKTKKCPGGGQVSFGEVYSQSTAPGSQVTASLSAPHKVTLVAFTGSSAGCQVPKMKAGLKGMEMQEALDLMRKQRCRVDLNYRIKEGIEEAEVESIAKSGGAVNVKIAVPTPENNDLFLNFREHPEGISFLLDSKGYSKLSAGARKAQQWTLTKSKEMRNYMTIQVFSRNLCPEDPKRPFEDLKFPCAFVDDAMVYVDATDVGAAEDPKPEATRNGDEKVSFYAPQAGTIDVVAVWTGDNGVTVYGSGRVKVVDREKGDAKLPDGAEIVTTGGRVLEKDGTYYRCVVGPQKTCPYRPTTICGDVPSRVKNTMGMVQELPAVQDHGKMVTEFLLGWALHPTRKLFADLRKLVDEKACDALHIMMMMNAKFTQIAQLLADKALLQGLADPGDLLKAAMEGRLAPGTIGNLLNMAGPGVVASLGKNISDAGGRLIETESSIAVELPGGGPKVMVDKETGGVQVGDQVYSSPNGALMATPNGDLVVAAGEVLAAMEPDELKRLAETMKKAGSTR